MIERGQKIAVVGGGIAGIVAAYMLQHHHEVTLFDKNSYLGGHTNTIELTEGPDVGLAVDTGFIVLNDATYPRFQKFLGKLRVPVRISEMSFGFNCCKTGLVYAGNDLNGLFAQRGNIVSPSFLKFLLEIGRFSRKARGDLEQDNFSQITLRDYLTDGSFSPFMIENYLVPMASAIWSTPPSQVLDYPARSFLGFFKNHGLLSLFNRPPWRTVVGGSHSYVRSFERGFRGEIFLNAEVRSIARSRDEVRLIMGDGGKLPFDQVIIATHADQALRLLENPCPDELKLLSPWEYQRNRTVLHTDSGVMPKQRQAWSAWNFTREKEDDGETPVFVSYYMNRLQGFDISRDYFVTLNRPDPYPHGSVIAEMDYYHPIYTFDSLETQEALPGLNGENRTYYCGSYFGHGFHEDAVKAAVGVAKHFGVEL